MKYALILALFLTGCSTVTPVARNFPEAPSTIMQKCPDLKKLDNGAKLSQVAKVVTENYTTYYECAVKSDAWIEWYETQKKIFDGVK
jgi:PBP1b-binding outer membrane lipoprotein LpoB